jgi:hypothetical protein
MRTRCEACGADVEFVSLEQATRLTGKTSDEIQHSVLINQLHTSTIGGGAVRICLRSLLEGLPVPKSLKAPQVS